ncbi:MAG TPA: HEAT repeat domain-containing protein, partial [Longimicrobium sp.]|nr:HEAT repeat domain-containing protein [Longimicrobium sp.]
ESTTGRTSLDDTGPDAAPGSEELEQLLHTALHDRRGETVEGGFVDRWESYASRAIDALEEIFSRRGFSDADAGLVRAAVRDPGAPADAAVALLGELGRWTRPLVEELLDDPLPAARTVAVRAGARLLHPVFLLGSIRDDDAAVRAAAVRALAERRNDVPGAKAHLARALEDPDPRVRIAAGETSGFLDDPAAGEALVQRVYAEPEGRTRRSIIAAVARTVRSEGTHVAPDTLARRMGEPVRQMLLRELSHDDPAIRTRVASALERLRGEDVAAAMLERLRIEEVHPVRATLLLFNGYPAVADRALPVLASLLAADADALVRTRAAHLLEGFGAAAAAPLLAALGDPDGNVRRAAVMGLGRVGDLRVLPVLADELARPDSRGFRREIESAIRDVAARATAAGPAPPPSPALSARIQAWIDGLEPEPGSGWPVRVCKEQLNALPLHASIIYLWALRPDGTLLCMDHEAFGHPTEPESEPLAAFAAIVQGARTYPELRELIPAPPAHVQPCDSCDGNGWRADRSFCSSCRGFGWWIR